MAWDQPQQDRQGTEGTPPPPAHPPATPPSSAPAPDQPPAPQPYRSQPYGSQPDGSRPYASPQSPPPPESPAAPPQYGTPPGFSAPPGSAPPPSTPLGPFVTPSGAVLAPPAPPPGPANPLRAIAVAVLNLSGLGIGYALVRRWLAMVVCWIATALLLLAALPADPDGVSTGTLSLYLAFLALAAAHGAFRGLRSPLSWPPQAPLALVLGIVLLAVPASGAVLYGNARDEAIEQALEDRLDTADRLVQAAKNEPFSTSESRYRKALATYHDLDAHHADSRAGHRVPDSLKTYYTTVATPYAQKKYCDAVAPLKYLRTVPDSIDKQRLGSLTTWPDDRLATSLYECGLDDLGYDKQSDTEGGNLAELLTTFPKSPQAAKVEPAVSAAIDSVAKDLKGDEPCAANDRLRTLSSQASQLPGDKAGVADALSKDADRADQKVQSGTYACGVDQYRDGDFDSALSTMNDFMDQYKHDKNRASAKRIAIAAEIAQDVPAAGKHLPRAGSGGSIAVTVSNDSPDEIEILYTGPVTGSFTLGACGSCSTYGSESLAALSACKDSGTHYPSKTIYLPVGTTYFLHKTAEGTSSNGTDTAKLEPGYTYTECAYVVQTYGTGGSGGSGSA